MSRLVSPIVLSRQFSTPYADADTHTEADSTSNCQTNENSQFPSSCTEYFLSNRSGVSLSLLSFGSILHSLRLPSRSGDLANVLLSFPSLADYIRERKSYVNCTVGRFANRIAGGSFNLDGENYRVPTNEAEKNCLHGGDLGFSMKNFQLKSLSADDDEVLFVELELISPHLDEGFPGLLTLNVRFSLNSTPLIDNNSSSQAPADSSSLPLSSSSFLPEFHCLTIEFTCRVQLFPTVINICRHEYFNLSGNFHQRNILNHELFISAEEITVNDENNIPTGEIRSVNETKFDFTKLCPIGGTDSFSGFDQNFVVKQTPSTGSSQAPVSSPSNFPFAGSFVSQLIDRESGRVLEIYSTAPGVQLYTANHFPLATSGSEGFQYEKHAAVCLESQFFPNSPNQPSFPSTVLRPGQLFKQSTAYVFRVLK